MINVLYNYNTDTEGFEQFINKTNPRLIILEGPPASGKTMLANKLKHLYTVIFEDGEEIDMNVVLKNLKYEINRTIFITQLLDDLPELIRNNADVLIKCGN